jgi:hypothetical protein
VSLGAEAPPSSSGAAQQGARYGYDAGVGYALWVDNFLEKCFTARDNTMEIMLYSKGFMCTSMYLVRATVQHCYTTVNIILGAPLGHFTHIPYFYFYNHARRLRLEKLPYYI